MGPIRFVFFDIGYTLVDETDVWTCRCAEQAQTAEARRLGLTAARLYAEIEKASAAYRPQFRAVVQKFGFTQVAPYRHELEKLYPGTEPVLRALAARYPLGVLANQTDGLRGRLQSFGILRYFSQIISSWDYQTMKPDSRLFRIALQKAGCPPEETVMVGDRLDNDIFPAKALGMHTVWIRQGFGGLQAPRSEAYVPDAEIHRLEELLRLL